MAPVSLAIRTLHRFSDEPLEDEALARSLVQMVRGAVAQGRAPAAAVCVREERLDLLPVAEAARSGIAPPVLLAGLTRAEVPFASEVLAVGLVGRFKERTTGVPLAMVFLEWEDCRWWHWRALIDPSTGALREDTETVSRAVEGLRRPALGGWWTAGRRRGMRVRLAPREPPVVH